MSDQLDIERLKEQVNVLRQMQCCDVQIDGKLGALITDVHTLIEASERLTAELAEARRTIAILSDNDAVRGIAKGLEDIQAGRTIPLEVVRSGGWRQGSPVERPPLEDWLQYGGPGTLLHRTIQYAPTLEKAAHPKVTRNSETLADFVAFCEACPSLRFWQALRAWCGQHVYLSTEVEPLNLPKGITDSFYREGKLR